MSLVLHSLSDRLQRRRTVYVSSAMKAVFFRGRSLVLQRVEEEETVIPLAELRRFVVLGVPPLTVPCCTACCGPTFPWTGWIASADRWGH